VGEVRRIIAAGDDAERSDGEERRMTAAGDDAERSDGEERRMTAAGLSITIRYLLNKSQ
jgi:hypothetical protein